MSVQELCEICGWDTISDLARAAGINWATARNAWNKKLVQPRSKKDICRAFSEKLDREIKVTDIDWEEPQE